MAKEVNNLSLLSQQLLKSTHSHLLDDARREVGALPTMALVSSQAVTPTNVGAVHLDFLSFGEACEQNIALEVAHKED